MGQLEMVEAEMPECVFVCLLLVWIIPIAIYRIN